MSSQILSAFGRIVVSLIWNSIQSHLFKPDTREIDAIMGGFDRLDNLVRQIDFDSQLRGPMDKIYYWTERMDNVIDDLNRLGGNFESVQAYNQLLDAMRSDTDGIRFQTSILYSTLMTPRPPLTGDGLLAFWAAGAYSKLSDVNNTSYHIDDYTSELDINVAAIAAILHHGLNLSFFVATDSVDADRLKAEAVQRVNTFRNTLFNTHYPPAIRIQLKPSGYDDPGTFLTTANRYFHLREEADTTGRKFLTILNYWIRLLTLAGPGGDSAARIRGFRFVRADKPLGPLEMHAYWQSSNGNSRIRFYDYKPAGSQRTYAYTNSTSGTTYTIRFKLIPLSVSGGNGNTTRTPVKLVPYREDTGGRTTGDSNGNTFGNTWRLEVTTSPE